MSIERQLNYLKVTSGGGGGNCLKEMNYTVPRRLVYNSINFQIVYGIVCTVIIT